MEKVRRAQALEGSPPFEKRGKFSRKRVEKKMVNVHMRASGTIYIFCSGDTHYKLDLPG